ncbi:hypothetical protein BJ508DRAFT_163404 [Ascobolus immersus RN42]|uniref:Uncharacterized protein n=1 Tax=Ascobolus immersus RN42 TaxID=1160509 RepID=A0A3N4HVB7_ASCIM|nr:hypothetical protein BJ508DRAFT_163404 [Ascobolus immersus RN42]
MASTPQQNTTTSSSSSPTNNKCPANLPSSIAVSPSQPSTPSYRDLDLNTVLARNDITLSQLADAGKPLTDELDARYRAEDRARYPPLDQWGIPGIWDTGYFMYSAAGVSHLGEISKCRIRAPIFGLSSVFDSLVDGMLAGERRDDFLLVRVYIKPETDEQTIRKHYEELWERCKVPAEGERSIYVGQGIMRDLSSGGRTLYLGCFETDVVEWISKQSFVFMILEDITFRQFPFRKPEERPAPVCPGKNVVAAASPSVLTAENHRNAASGRETNGGLLCLLRSSWNSIPELWS